MKFRQLLADIWLNYPISRHLYHLLTKNSSVENLLLADRLETVEIRAGVNKNLKMELNLKHERSYFVGSHETGVQEALARVVCPGMTAFNIGAHVGFFTLMLNRLVGPSGDVVGFEPNPRVRERLRGNLSLNHVDGQVQVEECALGDLDGVSKFSVSLSDTQGRFEDLPCVKPGTSIEVPCKRLDTYVEETGRIPHFVLMDVEHAEGRVLRGMSSTMEVHRPIMLIEMHGPAAIEEAWKELERHGYCLASVPDLRMMSSVDQVAYGHYLAAPPDVLKRNGRWGPY